MINTPKSSLQSRERFRVGHAGGDTLEDSQKPARWSEAISVFRPGPETGTAFSLFHCG